MISYAQNYEDVMLRRALNDIDKGFYIDVGANDPVVDSVTKAFYDAGWRGINIEPVSEWYEKLQQDRPDDINLQLAVGARKDKVNLYEVVGTGLSTMDESIAKRHAQEHGFELKSYKVPVVMLTTICEQHPHSDIHFLKIDVEGSEQSVLQGLNLKKIRPWIILVESTLPNYQIENYEVWEHSITERGYHYVYFDGLNRYYVADEHDELDAAFLAPPNYFDHFKRASEDWIERHAKWLENEWDAAKTRLETITSELAATKTNAEQLNTQLNEKSEALANREVALAEQRTRANLLQKEWDAAKTRLETITSELAATKTNAEQLNAQLNEKSEVLANREVALAEQRTRANLLQKEWDAAKTRLEELIGNLATTKANAEHLNAQLGEKVQALADSEVALTEQKSRNQWLQNEWEAAKHKVDELHQSNHHWWLEADRLNKELQAVYGSKSWRITLPLRKFMQLFKWLFSFPIRLSLWFVRLPKRTTRWLLVKAVAYALKRPGLKVRAMARLRKYPNLEAKLRRLARARGLVAAQPGKPPMPAQPVPESPEPEPAGAGNDAPTSGVDLSHLTVSTHSIYRELKAAMARHQKENG